MTMKLAILAACMTTLTITMSAPARAQRAWGVTLHNQQGTTVLPNTTDLPKKHAKKQKNGSHVATWKRTQGRSKHHKGGGPDINAIASDIRLKADIVPLARLDNGLELYRFRYKGSDHTNYVGVMAQEVQEIEPSAVSRGRDGYLVVNYDRLGLKFMTWDEWLAQASVNDQLAH